VIYYCNTSLKILPQFIWVAFHYLYPDLNHLAVHFLCTCTQIRTLDAWVPTHNICLTLSVPVVTIYTPVLTLKILHFVHVVYSHIPYGTHSKQWLFSYAEFIGLYNGGTLFSVRYEVNHHIQYINFSLERAKEHMFFLGFQYTSYRFRDLMVAYFRLIQNYTFHDSSLQRNRHTVTWSSAELEVIHVERWGQADVKHWKMVSTIKCISNDR